MLDNGVPQIHHRSFFDFLTAADHCTDDLLIDLGVYHTQIATCCFQIMNKHLNRNILDLQDPVMRFMDNEEGLVAQESLESQPLHRKVSPELRYACTYWINHVKVPNTEDKNLVKEGKMFITEHLLHWLGAPSWVGKLDRAHRTLHGVPEHLVN
jgi:hypothetical protein